MLDTPEDKVKLKAYKSFLGEGTARKVHSVKIFDENKRLRLDKRVIIT